MMVTVEPTRIAFSNGDFVPRFLDLPLVKQVKSSEIWVPGPDETWDYIEILSGGTVKIARDRDTTLRFTHFFPLPGSHFDCGVEETGDVIPVGRHVRLVVRDQPFDPRDKFRWGNGLVNFGTRDMCAERKLPAWTTAVGDLPSGTLQVTLTEDLPGWAVGDELLIPDEDFASRRREAPLFITGVTGRVVTLSHPLNFDHLQPRDPDNVAAAPIWVANLTRPIIQVTSENPTGIRGHVADAGMDAMWCSCDVEYSKLGRTRAEPVDDFNPLTGALAVNQKGRYTHHHHHAMGFGSKSLGNVYRGSGVNTGKWAEAVHGTHDAEVIENIAVDFYGAGLVTEDGYEVRNLFKNNFTAYMDGEGGPSAAETHLKTKNPGVEGTGQWHAGMTNRFIGNVSLCNLTAMSLINGVNEFVPPAGSYPSVPGGPLDTPIDRKTSVPLTFADNWLVNAEIGLDQWSVNKYPNTRTHGIYCGEVYVSSISNNMIPYLVEPDIVGKHGQGLGIHSSTSYTPWLRCEGGRVVGCAVAFHSGIAMDAWIIGTTIQCAEGLEMVQIPSNSLLLKGVVFKDLPGFPRKWITFSDGVVWQGPGNPFPLVSGRNPFRIQKGCTYKIEDHQGVMGDDYELFEPQQLASTLAWPATLALGSSILRYACPEDGITWGECWDSYGIGFNGEIALDADVHPLPGLINAVVRNGRGKPLPMPRAPITTPNARDTAPIEPDTNPFVWVNTLFTGDRTGLEAALAYSVDGGPQQFAWPEADVDIYPFRLRPVVPGQHTVKTWRVKAGAAVPASELTSQLFIDEVPPPPEPVTVPNVVGQMQAAATSALAAVGLGASATPQQDMAPVGTVLSQNPTAGTEVPKGSTVALVVASAPAEDWHEVNEPIVVEAKGTQRRLTVGDKHVELT